MCNIWADVFILIVVTNLVSVPKCGNLKLIVCNSFQYIVYCVTPRAMLNVKIPIGQEHNLISH